MPTALGRRSGAVYGEKSPKTRLARIYCYGNTLYVANYQTEKRCLRSSVVKATVSGTIFPGFEPRRGLLFFIICFFVFLNLLFFFYLLFFFKFAFFFFNLLIYSFF